MFTEKISRRKFLFLCGEAALILSGCRTATPPQETTQQIQEITGKFPKDKFAFTPAILKHDLIPSVLPKNQWALDRMQAGVGYLQKVAAALTEEPQYSIATLGSISAVSRDSYPVAFSDTTTVLDVIQNLAKDISDRRLILWGASMTGVPYLVGTVNNPVFKAESGWQMESQIHANASFPFGNPRDEESGTRYSQYTDLQVALKMIHEYVHCRQGQELLKLVVSEHEKDIASKNNDVNYVRTLIDTKVKELALTMNRSTKIDRNQVQGEVAFNESQANQISQLVLQAINKLNADKRMPGTENDSYPVSPNSLYRTFLRAIVDDRNLFDPAWLRLHANWGR